MRSHSTFQTFSWRQKLEIQNRRSPYYDSTLLSLFCFLLFSSMVCRVFGTLPIPCCRIEYRMELMDKCLKHVKNWITLKTLIRDKRNYTLPHIGFPINEISIVGHYSDLSANFAPLSFTDMIFLTPIPLLYECECPSQVGGTILVLPLKMMQWCRIVWRLKS